jgi:peptidyl-prolyl cis-trans isomerase A (cyclophilin A)
MKQRFSQQFDLKVPALITTLLLLWPTLTWASIESAIARMEDQTNPLVELNTSKGQIYLELFANEAPLNVAQILALIAGEVELVDENTGSIFKPRYYNGMIFHRVIPGAPIQTGSSYLSPVGAPTRLLDDEINGAALGLASEKVLGPDAGTNPILNIVSEEGFKTAILIPLYADMDITDASDVIAREDAIITRLMTMTVKELYELQGVSYLDNRFSHPNLRGTVALANTGPDTNGPEFFINLNDAPWLDGKHTVIGSVVEGLDAVDAIGSVEITAIRPSRLSSVIYSARRVH